MPIKRTASGDFERYVSKRVENLRRTAIETLKYMGEEAVREARLRGRYKDQTGNLRSSIGYCVLDDGKPIFGGDFETFKEGQEGAQQGREFLYSLISQHSSGLVLIVVAGMEYAQYVEAKNLNVIDSAEQLVERELPKLLEGLKIKKQ